MERWTLSQFAYFVRVRERLRPKFIYRGLGDEFLEHHLDVAAIHTMQKNGVV